MHGPTQNSSSLPAPAGPTDDGFVYRLAPAAKQILSEHQNGGAPLFEPAAPLSEVREAVDAETRRRRREHLYRRARQRGRRLGTISSLWRGRKRQPFLRLSGEWLRDAGFDAGRHFEVAVEEGRLVIEGV